MLKNNIKPTNKINQMVLENDSCRKYRVFCLKLADLIRGTSTKKSDV